MKTVVECNPGTSARLTPGTRRADNDMYVGVLRVGRQVVAECGHLHRNRDISSRTNGPAARDCMKDIVAAAKRPSLAAERATRIRTAWMNTQRGPWATTAAQVERLKVELAADAVAYEALVVEVRSLLDQFPTETTTAPVVTALDCEVGEMPDWMTE